MSASTTGSQGIPLNYFSRRGTLSVQSPPLRSVTQKPQMLKVRASAVRVLALHGEPTFARIVPHRMSELARLKPFFVAGAAFLGFVQIFFLAMGLARALQGDADFVSFYAAGTLVARGQARDLYSYAAITGVEREVRSGRAGATLPFIHPAYEAMWFRQLARLSYPRAYTAFWVVNLLCLCSSFFLLSPRPWWVEDFWPQLIGVLFAVFVPVGICLLQGQDSMVLLLLLAGVARFLRTNKEFEAGVLLGMGVFRFQIVTPIALLYLAWKRWKVFGGFAMTAVAAVVLSILVAGPETVHTYPEYLRQISLSNYSESQSLAYSVWPMAMPNLRGAMTFLFAAFLGPKAIQVIIVSASLMLWIWAGLRRFPLEYCVIVALLISYHGNVHDTVLLLIPLASFLRGSKTISTPLLALWSLAVFFPAVCLATGLSMSLYGLVLLTFLIVIYRESIRRIHSW